MEASATKIHLSAMMTSSLATAERPPYRNS